MLQVSLLVSLGRVVCHYDALNNCQSNFVQISVVSEVSDEG